jgi:hypothetical protein
MAWWSAAPEPDLSQGDVIRDVPVAVVFHPLAQLTLASVKGGQAWTPSATWQPNTKDNGVGSLLARGRVVPVLVVTHSCQLDKGESKERVIVAPIYPLSATRPDEQSIILAQRRISKMPLPDVPGLGPSYADLRMITAVDRSFLPTANRLAQLTTDGCDRLHAQLVGFFTNLDPNVLFAKLVPPTP